MPEIQDLIQISEGVALQNTAHGPELVHYEKNGMVFEELTQQEYKLTELCTGVAGQCGATGVCSSCGGCHEGNS